MDSPGEFELVSGECAGLPTLATAVQRFPSLGLQASSSSTDSPHGSPASSTADRQLEAAFAASSPDPAAPAYRPPPARVELAACTDVGAAVPRSTHTLNFLVVGEAGTGKTALVRTLFGAFAARPTSKGSSTSTPGVPCCTSYSAEGRHASIHFNVQEHTLAEGTQGRPDALVATSFASYHSLEAQHLAPTYQLPDCRVDVCLLLAPAKGRLGPGLQAAAARLATAVPVIPVLAMADTLTARELQERKRAVRTSLGLPPRSTLLYPAQPSLLADALAAVGLGEAQGPLSAIAGDGLDTSVGRFWPVRRYPWATLHPYHSSHSDALELRLLLTGPGFHPLKCATEARYRTWLQAQAVAAPPLPRAGPRGGSGLLALHTTPAACPGGIESDADPAANDYQDDMPEAAPWLAPGPASPAAKASGDLITPARLERGPAGGRSPSAASASTTTASALPVSPHARAPAAYTSPVGRSTPLEPAPAHVGVWGSPEEEARPLRTPEVPDIPWESEAYGPFAPPVPASHQGEQQPLRLCLLRAAAGGRGAEEEPYGASAPPAAASQPGEQHHQPLLLRLHRAAAGGRADEIEAALAAGADVNAVDGQGQTALHVAAAHASVGAVQVLLSHGADPDAADAGGRTPLCAAAASGALQAVRALLAAGADPSLEDGSGRIPEEVAAARGQAAVAGVLAQHRIWGVVP